MKLIIGSSGPDIFIVDFNPKSLNLNLSKRISVGGQPTWLVSYNNNLLYSTDETGYYYGSGAYENKVGGIIVFKVDHTDDDSISLSRLQTVLSKGHSPTHLSFSKDGSTLRVANYFGGVFSTFRIDEDGLILNKDDKVLDLKKESDKIELGPNSDRQDSSHPHWMGESPLSNGKFIYGTDLGQDKVYQFERADNDLRPLDVEFIRSRPGAGPRHIVFHPSKPNAYIVNELDATVSTYGYDSVKGYLSSELQWVPTAPEKCKPGQTCPSAIQIDKSGKFIYLTNRDISSNKTGSDSIVVYKVLDNGLLDHVQTMETRPFPRHGDLSPDEKWYIVGNQHSNSIEVFSREADSGELERKAVLDGIEQPTFVYFVKSEE